MIPNLSVETLLLFLDITCATAATAVFVGDAALISFRIETRTLVARIKRTIPKSRKRMSFYSFRDITELRIPYKNPYSKAYQLDANNGCYTMDQIVIGVSF